MRIALTGGIATGKSYVRGRFEALGVPTIDADTLAREAVAPGTAGFAAVLGAFGRDVLDRSGGIDRKALGAIVFGDPAKRKTLEGIIHPAVREASQRWFAGLDASIPFAIADIPLLYETGRDREFDKVIVTACDPEEQIRRVMKRDGLTEPDARQRLAAQMPIDQKVKRANFVIRTDGTFENTDLQVRNVFEALRSASRASR